MSLTLSPGDSPSTPTAPRGRCRAIWADGVLTGLGAREARPPRAATLASLHPTPRPSRAPLTCPGEGSSPSLLHGHHCPAGTSQPKLCGNEAHLVLGLCGSNLSIIHSVPGAPCDQTPPDRGQGQATCPQLRGPWWQGGRDSERVIPSASFLRLLSVDTPGGGPTLSCPSPGA